MKSQSPSASDAVSIPGLVAAAERALPQQADALARARGFAEPLIAHETLDTGENTLAHADAVAAILRQMGGSEAMQAASYLVHACPYLARPQESITRGFGESYAALAIETNQLMAVQRQARAGARDVRAACSEAERRLKKAEAEANRFFEDGRLLGSMLQVNVGVHARTHAHTHTHTERERHSRYVYLCVRTHKTSL